MAKTSHYGENPKRHRISSAAHEESDRAIHRADEANWRFYQDAQEAARNVSIIQTGVKEDVANVLIRGMRRPDAIQEAIKRERVQSELYRAVQGNEYYETDGVPDPSARGFSIDNTTNPVTTADNKHYRASENQEQLEGNGVLGRTWSRLWRGTASVVGANNFVEAAVVRRFGNNQEIQARRNFVAERMRGDLNLLATTALADFNAVSAVFGMVPYVAGAPLPPYLNALIGEMANANLRQLRDAQPQLAQSRAYHDLMMLVDLDQRETVKIGVEGVYNAERLRAFMNARVRGGGNQAIMMTTLSNRLLAENALYPLESKPEAMALVAEVERRFNEGVANGLSEDAAANNVNVILNTISTTELPEETMSERNVNTRNAINQTVEQVRTLSNKVQNSFHNARGLATTIQGLNAGIAAAGFPPASMPAMQTKIDNADATLKTRQDETRQQQTDLITQVENLRRQLRTVSPTAVIPPAFMDLLTGGVSLITDNDMSVPAPGAALPVLPVNHLITHLTANQIPLQNFYDVQIPTDFLTLLENRQRVTPFILLQRLLRRSYCEDRNINPNSFDETAAKYSTLMATMRVQDAKNADLYRNSSRKAAEFLQRGLTGRGVDKVKSALAKGQNWLGLELVNIEQQPGEMVLNQIINSREEFGVFKGVNKFSTTRDIREILNNTNKEVSLETLERFIQTMEEAVSEFKKGDPDAKKFALAGDWDLENLIVCLQKFKSERWTREFLDKLSKEASPGSREHAFVRMLQEQRAMEQKIAEEIRKEVKHPGAMWKKFQVKDELKQVLDEDSLKAMKELRNAGIEAKQDEIRRIQERMAGLPDGDAEKDKLAADVKNLQADIAGIKREIADSQNLYDRVEKAKQYIEKNKLSRSETKKYIQEVGLAGVWDKMSTNFRLQRYWKKTKAGAKALWGGTKKVWAWSRKKFINAPTGRKALSVGRLLASPVLGPLGVAYKISSYTGSLVGQAMMAPVTIPAHLYRMMSDSGMRKFLKKKPYKMGVEIMEYDKKITKLREKMSLAPYQRDKNRIADKIMNIELKIAKIRNEYAELQQVAQKRKLPIDPINIGQVASNIPKPA